MASNRGSAVQKGLAELMALMGAETSGEALSGERTADRSGGTERFHSQASESEPEGEDGTCRGCGWMFVPRRGYTVGLGRL